MALFWLIVKVSPNRNAAFFMILTTEMFLASCGHVANDGVAIPIFVWLFFEAERRSRLAVFLLAAGLLTKAYFLAVAPTVAWRLRAQWRWLLAASILPGAWYGRNLWLYGIVSGMQEQIDPLPLRDLIHAAIHLPWAFSLGGTFRGALWTGNNSFLQWSVWQVNLVIAGLLAALFVSLRRNYFRRRWLLGYAGCYLLALGYATIQTFVYTKGSGAASPWYATPLWLLFILVIFAGETPGWVLSSFVTIWSYWFITTFWFRLIPWYAGVMDGPATAANLGRWYGASFRQIYKEIGGPVLTLTLTATLLVIATAVLICRDFDGDANQLRRPNRTS